MKPLWITLTIIILSTRADAQQQDTVATRVKWTWKLPQPVRAGWKNCPYSSWKIVGIRRLVTHGDTLYTIHVALYQALGPDDADIAEEDRLYFSSTGKLWKVRKL
ncbi:MAG TPA: hypothetical protein VHE34_16970 [Puia sp.]|uniref:hypothetical protein n=1 Tax=Puia sp. TaxID=2045100 RepID=UPI002BB87768|nr:hypothetical protein [Puia sp.]HVU96926.1 hypothetical protein [Puia sp.]